MACHSEASEARILPVSPTPLVFNAPVGGVPLGRSLQMPNVQNRVNNIAEKFNRLSIGCTNVTDDRHHCRAISRT